MNKNNASLCLRTCEFDLIHPKNKDKMSRSVFLFMFITFEGAKDNLIHLFVVYIFNSVQKKHIDVRYVVACIVSPCILRLWICAALRNTPALNVHSMDF